MLIFFAGDDGSGTFAATLGEGGTANRFVGEGSRGRGGGAICGVLSCIDGQCPFSSSPALSFFGDIDPGRRALIPDSFIGLRPCPLPAGRTVPKSQRSS